MCGERVCHKLCHWTVDLSSSWSGTKVIHHLCVSTTRCVLANAVVAWFLAGAAACEFRPFPRRDRRRRKEWTTFTFCSAQLVAPEHIYLGKKASIEAWDSSTHAVFAFNYSIELWHYLEENTRASLSNKRDLLSYLDTGNQQGEP